MSVSTNKIAPPTTENKKCTTDAPTKTQKVNDCKLVLITLPNAGPLGLGLLEKDEGKSVVIDEVISQSQAEKYGVLAGDIPIYNFSISGIGYISYDIFLQRARDERPFIFSVLRSGINKDKSTNQSSVEEAAAPSRELKNLDGAPTKNNMDMVHTESINTDTVGQNKTANISGLIAVEDISAQLAAGTAAATHKLTRQPISSFVTASTDKQPAPLSNESKRGLTKWVEEHQLHPYPSRGQKDAWMKLYSIEKDSQLEGYLHRARKKLKEKSLHEADTVRQDNTTNINNSAAAVDDTSAKLAEQKTETTVINFQLFTELEVYMKKWLSSPAGNLMPSTTQKDKIILETGIERNQLEGWLYR